MRVESVFIVRHFMHLTVHTCLLFLLLNPNIFIERCNARSVILQRISISRALMVYFLFNILLLYVFFRSFFYSIIQLTILSIQVLKWLVQKNAKCPALY